MWGVHQQNGLALNRLPQTLIDSHRSIEVTGRCHRQGNHNIAILAYNYLDHHNAIIALRCNAKSHHDILGDQVMHGAVLGWSSGQNTVFMTYLIRKYVYISNSGGYSMEIPIFWDFHISRMSTLGCLSEVFGI